MRAVDRWMGTLIFLGCSVTVGVLGMLLAPPSVAWARAIALAVILLPPVFASELEVWSWSGALARLAVLMALWAASFWLQGERGVVTVFASLALLMGVAGHAAWSKLAGGRAAKRSMTEWLSRKRP